MDGHTPGQILSNKANTSKFANEEKNNALKLHTLKETSWHAANLWHGRHYHLLLSSLHFQLNQPERVYYRSFHRWSNCYKICVSWQSWHRKAWNPQSWISLQQSQNLAKNAQDYQNSNNCKWKNYNLLFDNRISQWYI